MGLEQEPITSNLAAQGRWWDESPPLLLPWSVDISVLAAACCCGN